MNNDGIVWEVLNNQFCSYKVKTDVGNLCRHPHNLTGRCNRRECPLANSKYATVRETAGRIYLCLKTAERAHIPSKQWERIELPKNFAQAVEVIDSNMQYWPKWMIHMCKQRLTKITQYLIRMRKLKLKNKSTLVPIKKKLERRERTREVRAEAAARLDQSIEKELLERLKSKAYGDQPLNVNEAVWKEILEGDAVEAESDVTTEDELEEENEYEFDKAKDPFAHEFVSDDSDLENDGEDMEDLLGMSASEFSSAEDEDEEEEDEGEYESGSDDEMSEDSDAADHSDKRAKGKRAASSAPRQKPTKRTKKHGPRVEIEYETEAVAKDNMLTNW
ncbi:Mak16 protein [Coemansia reversa NRRL 1564]|uniref:Protein MAK16 n=1 Tax=Coemansia reversa (strain ATCC 12441 / NRRL 1564) TaxID=763665 RepID=A0A2G5BIY1_COERN|nr:Mak16 protein [Coemansia reversa NRRL 1564]|eukprot:PIA18963.1 Mak16 protein [Coemansia reversa NRRL 1564]